MSNRSWMLGFDVQTPAGDGKKEVEAAGTAGKAPTRPADAQTWLRRYEARLERQGGLLEAGKGQETVRLQTSSWGKARTVPVERVLDGRTVAGLNRAVASRVAAGVAERKAVEQAMNQLARWRASPQAARAVQSAKAKRRERSE